ncbi:MAG: 50S ribosomal protein L21 [Spirochaetales bacterium]|jgi:large subunit ribosomal protein L21|nr:50S ribosomal protein L21 [Spirochaetales bacterium]
MYALVEIKGRQYKAEKGVLLQIDKVPAQPGEELDFGTVLLISSEGNVRVGTPYVDGVSVKAKVEGQTKGKKVRIFRYKRRKNYARRQGHRQQYTLIRVEDIQGA